MAKAIHMMVRVLDAEKSIDFYERAFGLTVADRFDFDDFTLARERSAQWAEEYERIAAQRDELAKELTATYPPIVNKLVDLFERIETADKEVDCIQWFGAILRSSPLARCRVDGAQARRFHAR